ncbi:MBL fold hydrolase [Actinoplanes sp. ATCC 53533]|uniref:MBL fold metallo-hydrolase n=1 Tax=Actinoplanes sp. ATCC 53533 TaxID=1288362 RepID=UPI000F796597|nr:MBL fold metallo-hydrolase [Actinoplanes sp. ATCC 53533]RSM65514.1 MBL fold hydrolase [Actinoplanes sp. ATCC 53533]
MPARLDVLTVGYADDRVAGTVVAIRDGDLVAVVDPGMVADRRRILDPLSALGVPAEAVTDVVFSHHHPDHTLNAALFTSARFHDFQAIYHDDVWQDRQWTGDTSHLSPSVRLLRTPGHTAEDVSTVVDTADGLVVCTHLWWTADGPADDPFAPDRELLRASRAKVLALRPALVVPGHGAPFTPSAGTPT